MAEVGDVEVVYILPGVHAKVLFPKVLPADFQRAMEHSGVLVLPTA